MAETLWYRAGSVDVTNGSNIISGLSTFWLANIRAGDMFSVTQDGSANIFYEVMSIDDNSQITIEPTYQEATATDADYAIIRNFTGRWSISADLAKQMNQVMAQFRTAMLTNFKGDKGDAGRDGNTILGDIGAPNPAIGNEGDWYIDMATWEMYRKEVGTWILRGTLRGERGYPGKDGTIWHATETPNDNTGQVGDFNFNSVTGDVHQRTITGWVLVGNFMGPRGLPGEQGIQGPRGNPGLAGSRWITGAGIPAGSLGVDTDMYLNTNNGDTFRKSGAIWTLQTNIRGRVGDQGVQGDPGMVFRGLWNSTTEYQVNDGVNHLGNAWLAIAETINVAPPTTSATHSNAGWTLLASRGLDGMGSGDMLKATYDPTSSGSVLKADLATVATKALTADVAASANAVEFTNVAGVTHSSESEMGIIRLATQAETTEGTLATVAVSPKYLGALISGIEVNVTDATEIAAGIIRIATGAEVTTGTSAVTAITPATLKAVIDAIPGSLGVDIVDALNAADNPSADNPFLTSDFMNFSFADWKPIPNVQVGDGWTAFSRTWNNRNDFVRGFQGIKDVTLTTPAGTFPGSYAFAGGVLLPDGRVFCVPRGSTTARIYDPKTDTLTTPAGTFPGSNAFYGGVLLPDGRVFCVPGNSTTAKIAQTALLNLDLNYCTSPYINKF